MTLGHLGGWGLSRAKEIIASQLMLKGTVKKDHRVEEEMCKLQLRNYKVICKGVTHALLPVAFYFLRAAILMPDLATVGICGLLLFTYTHHLLIGNEIIQLTPTRMKMICYVVHVQGVFFAIVMSTVKDLVFFSSMQPFLATGRIALLGFVDKSVTIPFHILYSAVDVVAYIMILEQTTWAFMCQILISHTSLTLASIWASCILDLWVKSRIEAQLETADAESLVSSFRRMLRGVCDGEALVDGQFKIIGESQCVQHLIMTTVSMAGKPLDHFVMEGDRQRFVEFIQSSTDDILRTPESQRRCAPCASLRVSFRGSAGIRVAADIYHVPVVGLYGAAEPFHLIAFKEDVESRAQPDAQDNAIPPQLVYKTDGAASGLTSLKPKSTSSKASSRQSSVVAVQELQEMTLLVDVNTEFQDILEVHLKFQREDCEDIGSELRTSMPTLRKVVRPMDWQRICEEVMSFADKAFWNPDLQPRHFRKGLAVRIPDDRQYLLAKEASIRVVAGKECGSIVWLHLSSFGPEKSKQRMQRLQPSLENIQEAQGMLHRRADARSSNFQE